MHVVVLGAGLAGLSAAYELARAGQRVTLLERESRVGGMAASWRKGPFWLEFGPHRFHTQDPEIEELLYEILDGEVVRRERLSRIYLRERFFRYPLEVGNVVGNLGPRLLACSLRDYLWIRARNVLSPLPDDNFENWVLKRFGRTLYDLFFEAYTSKAWGMPCTEISADWAAQRISQASLWDTVVKTVLPPKDGSVRSLVGEFLYPRRGGVGQIARKYAEKIRSLGGEIKLCSTVRGLERKAARIERVHYDFLGTRDSLEADWIVNTTPINRILPLVQPALASTARKAAETLEHVAIVFVYLEVDRPSVSTDHWIYLPEKQLRVHRVSEFKNFSDTSAPGDRTAICCEITCRAGDATWSLSLEQAARIAQADLESCGLLQPGESRPLDIARLARAYPVYRVGYQESVDTLATEAESLENWISTGRQGLFRYNNMDHSIAMGRTAARQIEEAEPATYVLPGEYFG
jgi:protoporphyrinogen oxidase